MLKSEIQLLLSDIISPMLTSSEENSSHLPVCNFSSSTDQLINAAASRHVDYFIIDFSMNNLCFILLPNFEINIYPMNIFY